MPRHKPELHRHQSKQDPKHQLEPTKLVHQRPNVPKVLKKLTLY